MNKPRLSEQQRRIVEHVDGPLLVVAGPGSGKTRVVTERIRRLLTEVSGHFRVLALTFTNKAANEMKDRLSDLGDARQRAFIGTLHSFCSDMLAERGKLVGVDTLPQIFEQFQDRKQVLLQAVLDDPLLMDELVQVDNDKGRNQKIDTWLNYISWVKAHPISCAMLDDILEKHLFEAYNAGLRACGAYDFDDLLLLAYRLLNENPKLADFYRRLYGYICIDEAQDLNEAQYAMITTLCGDELKNVLMVGDPNQSIYGFNTSSPEFMDRFLIDFRAEKIELSENFRSSKAVVSVAQTLEPNYMVEAQLPIKGCVEIFVGSNEADEAKQIVNKIMHLMDSGHEDVEGKITTSRCAILGRTRFTLIAIEKELKNRNIPCYKRLTVSQENESVIMDEFQLALRVLANPKDQLHLSALTKKWKVNIPFGQSLINVQDVINLLKTFANKSGEPRAKATVEALQAITRQAQRLDMMLGIQILRAFADELSEEEKRELYEDTIVLEQEWDQYLRSESSVRSIAGFMSSRALGSTQWTTKDGIALLTVHSAKGLEFDVVFIACMTEGVFPDYRARTGKELAEERRNAFVAVTRSKRLLYFSYPQRRMMPWGSEKEQQPSAYLRQLGLLK